MLEIYSRWYSELVHYIRRVIDNREKNQLTRLGKKTGATTFIAFQRNKKYESTHESKVTFGGRFGDTHTHPCNAHMQSWSSPSRVVFRWVSSTFTGDLFDTLTDPDSITIRFADLIQFNHSTERAIYSRLSFSPLIVLNYLIIYCNFI